MTTVAGCYSCVQEMAFDRLPPRECIAFDEHWRVAHCVQSAILGWLVLVPRRHVLTIAELTDAEAAALGTWQVRLSRALTAETGCVKTYVAQFAEAAGFGHVHFHVVPRAATLAAEYRGPQVFRLLGGPENGWISAGRMDEMALALTRRLAQG